MGNKKCQCQCKCCPKKLKNSTGSWDGMGYSRIRPRCTALCMNRHKKTALWVNDWFMTAPF